MWSLYKKKEDSNKGIFDYTGEELPPKKFSNGKTQGDIVKEVLNAIEQGNKIIFIKGVCGSGKSAMALNIARHFEKTSIVVPIKSLQKQYEDDYTKEKFILKKDNSKLKISVIKGRNNFRCPFTGERCDSTELPCTIELRERNTEQIRKYLKINPLVNESDFSSVQDVRRMSIAPACPYWSPVLPNDVNSRAIAKANKKKYQSISEKEYALFQRKKGCGYYDQYESYIDSDVLIFNSNKYIIENIIGRKPKTQIDIIDECDEFLDKFANEKSINLNKLVMALSNLFPDSKEKKEIMKRLIFDINELILNFETNIEKITNTPIISLIKSIIKEPHLAEDEEENYYNKVFEIARMFEGFLEETYASVMIKKDSFGKETKFINLVTINLAKRFEELLDSSENIILMSGTLHSEEVLRNIFGLKKFKIVEAETDSPGILTKYRTGLEVNCKYQNFKNRIVTRKDYLKAFSTCIANAKPPILVHVHAFDDLPNELEKAEYNLNNLITKERLLALQEKDRNNNQVEKFKTGEIDILFTTRCSRGMDFPGEKCNSIIITKYPYPNIQGLFWQILRQEQPDKFNNFYWDKAKRELLQKIFRGLRFKDDRVILLSPDSRILDARLG